MFTKYAHFLPLSYPYYATSLVEVFMQGVLKLHGMPRTIISYRSSLFLSMFWEAFFRRLNYARVLPIILSQIDKLKI